jgi:hypothetical protein
MLKKNAVGEEKIIIEESFGDERVGTTAQYKRR